MAGYHESRRREFERLRIGKARRLAESIDGPMKAPEIAKRVGVVLQTAHTLLDEAIRQGFVTVVGEKARGKACLLVRADAPAAQADAAQARQRILAACPASGYASATDVMAASGLPQYLFLETLRDLAESARIEAPSRRPAMLGLAPGHDPVGHPEVRRVEAADLFDHLNPMRLRIVQIVDAFGGIASARQVRGVMAEHGFELPGTLDVSTALPQEAKSGWVRILRKEGVWQARFELTDTGRRVAREANRTSPLPDHAPSRAPFP